MGNQTLCSSWRLVKFEPATLFYVSLVFGLVACSNGPSVDVEIRDTTPYHVFQSGKPFSFDILMTIISGESPEGLGYQWRDFRGNPLGPVLSIAGGVLTTVSSPSATPQPGYYGLTFVADDSSVTFNASSGSRKEIGFVVLPDQSITDRKFAPESPFGITHADLDDPYISTWVKTLTWNTTASKWWNGEMARRRDAGLQELPIVSGDGWVSDDSVAVPADFLAALEDKFRAYISADRAIEHWELGREENLSSRFEQRAYFANLESKAKVIRRASTDATPNLRLLYQIGGRSLGDAKAFFASAAVDDFDIFAPHPYAWPDFPTPEMWLESYIAKQRDAMRQHGVDFPIWFTEIGAPQNDAGVSRMLSGSKRVRGQSRDENAAFLIKTHVISLAMGIQKIFWYNYVDRGPSTTDVEDHFGLFDFWEFPKPSYAAYVNMVNCIGGKSFEDRRNLSGDIHVYEFSDGDRRCIVVWTYPEATKTVSLASILAAPNENNVTRVMNTVGTPLKFSTDVVIDGFPIFLTASVSAVAPRTLPVNRAPE